MIDSFLCGKKPPHLKMSINSAYLENGRYDQIVAHLEDNLEISGLENDRKIPIPHIKLMATKENENNPQFFQSIMPLLWKIGSSIQRPLQKNSERETTKTKPHKKVKKFHI